MAMEELYSWILDTLISRFGLLECGMRIVGLEVYTFNVSSSKDVYEIAFLIHSSVQFYSKKIWRTSIMGVKSQTICDLTNILKDQGFKIGLAIKFEDFFFAVVTNDLVIQNNSADMGNGCGPVPSSLLSGSSIKGSEKELLGMGLHVNNAEHVPHLGGRWSIHCCRDILHSWKYVRQTIDDNNIIAPTTNHRLRYQNLLRLISKFKYMLEALLQTKHSEWGKAIENYDWVEHRDDNDSDLEDSDVANDPLSLMFFDAAKGERITKDLDNSSSVSKQVTSNNNQQHSHMFHHIVTRTNKVLVGPLEYCGHGKRIIVSGSFPARSLALYDINSTTSPNRVVVVHRDPTLWVVSTNSSTTIAVIALDGISHLP
ncbi:hypothetical protein BKA70DRAFT_1220658 [Coprinopsis sp. MPI-PUGE-AT-0042]|nr:hypothetical protein BKA70DRAFT_1220658 [Coprinopsis sp. MPI-PUGE-AT-0042]